MAKFKVTISDAAGKELSGVNGDEGEGLDALVREALDPVTKQIMAHETQGRPHGITQPLIVNWEVLDA